MQVWPHGRGGRSETVPAAPRRPPGHIHPWRKRAQVPRAALTVSTGVFGDPHDHASLLRPRGPCPVCAAISAGMASWLLVASPSHPRQDNATRSATTVFSAGRRLLRGPPAASQRAEGPGGSGHKCPLARAVGECDQTPCSVNTSSPIQGVCVRTELGRKTALQLTSVLSGPLREGGRS